ncbi:MAG: hypothetical protein NTV86_22430 [Planctomycetota bacterium]|nr:hypothetical protein [Planctomycetota bacterium]
MQETALGLLRALARAGRHEEVVRRHTEAMQAIRADGGDPQMWCQTYSLLAWSYRKAGKAGELVRGLSATIPATPTPQEVGLWVGEAALDLVEALVAAGNPPQAVEQGRRLVEWLRRAVAEISPEPWQGEPVPAAASAITKMGEILRTGRMNEHLDGAQRLLEQEQFQEFRQRVLWVIRLPEVILMGLPRDLKTWEIPGALQRMALASHHLAAQSRHEFCSRIAKEMLAVAERLRGHPAYRYLRMGAVLDQLSVAASKADADGMEVVRRQVYAELEAGENELAAACPGVSGEAEAGNDDDRYWCERLSAAYMIAAGHLRQYRLIDAAEALRLTRREAQLHDAWITQEALARWTLGAQGDRRAALEHLRSAVTPETDFEYLQNVFHGCEEYASVRDDPEFLAVIKPPEGGDIGD